MTGPTPTASFSRRLTPIYGVTHPGHTYTFTQHPNGTTDIDVVIVREGKNLMGLLLGLVVGTIGKGVLKKAFKIRSRLLIRNGRAGR